MSLTLTKEGPAVYRYRTMYIRQNPLKETKNINLAVIRENGKTIYEAAFPKETLSLSRLQVGTTIKTNVALNDDDGKGRKWKEWFAGIVLGGKNPTRFGNLILVE